MLVGGSGMAAVSTSVTRRGQVARELRVHAHVVERTRRDRRNDVAGVRARRRGRAVVAALTGRDRPNDQPYKQYDAADSHIYLRRTGGSGHSPGPRTRVALSSTPLAMDTRTRPAPYGADPTFFAIGGALECLFRCRCIVAADGPGCKPRAAPSSAGRTRLSAGPHAGPRQSAVSSGAWRHGLRLHH